MRFDLADLRLFLHVATTGSITRGAAAAHLALASASERICGMEDALAVKLLTRGRRGVALTPAGECLADHARVILHEVDRLEGELGAYARGVKDRVRVLSNTAALSEHLPKAIAGFLAANPDVDIDLEERESAAIVESVARGDADIGIASEAALSDAVTSYRFRKDRLVLIVPHGDRLAGHQQVSFEDLIGRDFVGLSADSALQRHLANQAARLGARMRLRVRVGSFDALCRLVGAGVGSGIVPHAAARRYKRVARFAVVGLKDRWCMRTLVICVRRGAAPSAAAKRLLTHLRSTA